MAEQSEILEQLTALLLPYIKKDSDIVLTKDSELMGDLGLDSVKVMDLLLNVEDSFDISVPLSELPDVRTVNDFVVLLEKLTAPNHS